MNSVFVFVLCLVALAFATMDDSLFMAKFQEFKLKHQKSYASKDEEAKRFQIFKANVIAAEERNQRDPYAHFGVTKFSDMTPKEFKSIILMTNISQPEQPKLAGRKFPASPSLPTSFDWKTKSNIVTTVKDQGQCGSCWDFSATETIESVCALAGYPLTKLSEQQILDCDTSDYGCNGGWPYLAYKIRHCCWRFRE
jgi:C1A family cysteine protease